MKTLPNNSSAPLQSQLRTNSLDVRGQQPNLYPFEAFEFDDPNRTEVPELKLKDPWHLVADRITVEALEAAFIAATEIVVGFLGADPDNPVVGDRRLVIKAFILTLEHYLADTTWAEDIALGGYDDSGTFMNYIQAIGITRDRANAGKIKTGIGIPNPVNSGILTQFSNSKDLKRVGEFVNSLYDLLGVTYDGEAAKYAYVPLFSENSSTWGSKIVYWHSLKRNSHVTDLNMVVYFQPDTVENTDRAFINIHPGFWGYSGSTYVMATHGVVYFKINTLTGRLVVYTYCYSAPASGSSTVTDYSYQTSFYLKPGINYLNYKMLISSGPGWDGTTIDYYKVSTRIEAVQLSLRDADGDFQTEDISASHIAPVATSITLTHNHIDSYSPNTASAHTNYYEGANGGKFSALVYQGHSSECQTIPVYHVNPTSYVFYTPEEIGEEEIYINPDYFENHFSRSTEWGSLIDTDKDVGLVPDSSYGKVVLFSGTLLPESYEGKYITVSGPSGAQGPTGATGDTGATGATGDTYVDGGVADSLYQTDLIIDGGGA